MNHSPLHLLAAAAALALACMPVHAINEVFAKDAPIANMTQEDLDIAGATMRKALDEGRDGQSFDWKNPNTSASGTVIALPRFEKDGMHCRGAAFTTEAKGKTGKSKWNLCKTPQGWKVLEGRR
jgi:surface antigen